MDWPTFLAIVIWSLILLANMADLRAFRKHTGKLRAESKRFEAEWQKFLNEVEAAVTNK